MPIPVDLALAVAVVMAGGRPAIRLAQHLARRCRGPALRGDPLAALDAALGEQMRSLHAVRRGVAALVSTEKRLEPRAAELEASRDRLRTEARAALVAGREDLARAALTRAEGVAGQLETVLGQRRQLRAEAGRLQATAERLRVRVDGVRAHRDTLRQRSAAARARAALSARWAARVAGGEAVGGGRPAPPSAPPPSLDDRLRTLRRKRLAPPAGAAPTGARSGPLPPSHPPSEDP